MTGFVPVTLELLSGFGTTLLLFALTLLFALPLGLIISFGSMSSFKPLKAVTKTFVWIIRGVPLMLQLFLVFYVPGMLFDIQWPTELFGCRIDSRFLAALVAFVINYACYFSEIYRGGIESIPRGQYEAGMVLGMTRRQIFFKVVLMQVVKRITPPMANEIITLVKDTSLAYVLSYTEMFMIAKEISARQANIIPIFVAGAFYYIFNLVIAAIMSRIEKRLEYYR